MMTHEGFVLMQNKIETQKGENMILRQKLQSKSEALLILSKELEKARVDCDDYKELTNRLQTKYSNLKNGQLNIALGKQSETFNSRTFRDRLVFEDLPAKLKLQLSPDHDFFFKP